MFRRLLGRTGKSAPHHNQIEVICPLCGAAQREPRLVLTTFCKGCGEHLRIGRDGTVIASVHINPAPSAAYPSVAEAATLGDLAEGRTEQGSREDAPGPEARPPARLDEATAGSGWRAAARKKALSARREASSDGETPAATTDPALANRPDARAASTGANRHLFHYFKEVECFDCRSKFTVGRHARSPVCPSCGHTICLDDLDIKVDCAEPIRTGGDVVIRKSASVRTSEVRCRNLTLMGRVSADIDCAGDLLIGMCGTLVGAVRCQRLVVDEDCEIKFKMPVRAGEVEIRGRASGHIQCSGLVKISPTGWVQGDVTARAVSIEPGGQLDGAMNIVRSLSTGTIALAPAYAPATASGSKSASGSATASSSTPATASASTVAPAPAPASAPATAADSTPPASRAAKGASRSSKGGSRRSK